MVILTGCWLGVVNTPWIPWEFETLGVARVLLIREIIKSGCHRPHLVFMFVFGVDYNRCGWFVQSFDNMSDDIVRWIGNSEALFFQTLALA